MRRDFLVYALLVITGVTSNLGALLVTVLSAGHTEFEEGSPHALRFLATPGLAFALSFTVILATYVGFLYLPKVTMHSKIHLAGFLTALLFANLIHDITVFQGHFVHVVLMATAAALVPTIVSLTVCSEAKPQRRAGLTH